MHLSPTTNIWWDCHARLDGTRGVLLFYKDATEQPATRAVPLGKYGLAHELHAEYAGRAAAFELVAGPSSELPPVVLAADGSMMSRKWICALQEAIDASPRNQSPESPRSVPDGARPQDTPAPPPPPPDTPGFGTPPPMPQPTEAPPSAPAFSIGGISLPQSLRPFAQRVEQLFEYSAVKIDEMDKKLSGTLDEQAAYVEAVLPQMARDKELLAEVVIGALQSFEADMERTMASQLLKLAEAQREYHADALAQLDRLCASLSTVQPPQSPERPAPAEAAEAPAAAVPVAEIVAPVEQDEIVD